MAASGCAGIDCLMPTGIIIQFNKKELKKFNVVTFGDCKAHAWGQYRSSGFPTFDLGEPDEYVINGVTQDAEIKEFEDADIVSKARLFLWLLLFLLLGLLFFLPLAIVF